MQFGRTCEEFEVRSVYMHRPGKTVTEYDDHLFCLLTRNHHPLHMDANYAEDTTDFGKNFVVGNYIYSLLLGMSAPDVAGTAITSLEIESLKRVAPTRSRARWRHRPELLPSGSVHELRQQMFTSSDSTALSNRTACCG